MNLSKTVYVTLEDIKLNSDGMSNCREALEGIEELAADIKSKGLLNDLGLWQPPGKEHYVLNYGYRRHAALSWLKTNDPEAYADLGKIQCKVFGGSLMEALTRNLAENLKRKAINRADLIKRVHYLHEDAPTKMTEVAIAHAIGKSQSDISAMLGIALGCADAVLVALRKGFITYNITKKLSKLPIEEQEPALEKLLDADPAQAAAFKKVLEKKVSGTLRPGLKTIRETVVKVAQDKSDTDKDYRAGVAMGLRYCLGMAEPEHLYAPPHTIPDDYLTEPKKLKRTVRAQKKNTKAQFQGKPENDKA